MKLSHKEELAKLRAKLKDTQHFLKKTNDEVVKPLMQEIKLAEELKSRYKTQYDKNFEDLRILNAMMRLPRMSDQFYKTIKKIELAEKFEKRSKEAIAFMRLYVKEENNEEFFNKFAGHLNKTVPEQISFGVCPESKFSVA